MMDPLEMNHVLPENDVFPAIGNADLNPEGSDFMMLGSADLEQMLNDEGAGIDLELDDSEIDSLINPGHHLNVKSGHVQEVQVSTDGFDSMPIVEVDDKNVEDLLTTGYYNQSDFAPVPIGTSNTNYAAQQTQPQQQFMVPNIQPDPLLGNRNRDSGMSMAQQERIMRPVNAFQQILEEGEGDAFQRMLNNAMMDGTSMEPNAIPGLDNISPLDLEQEKMQLLSRLNEINQRQNVMPSNNQMGDGNVFLQNNVMEPIVGTGNMNQGTGNMFLQRNNNNNNNMNEMKAMNPTMPMNGMYKSTMSSGISSVVGMGTTSGETPLTSFLRKKSPPSQPSAAAAAGRSMLNMNIPGAPKAASVFSNYKGQFGDNNMPDGNQVHQNPLFGAMNSQDAVRKLSSQNLMPGSDFAGMLRQETNATQRNAAWGADAQSSFKTSGILPKHSSETHLLRAGRGNLVRSKSKTGSISRENLLYNHMKKSSSRNQIQREDSVGQLLPFKRRQGPGAKYKLGGSGSRSVPHLMINNATNSRGMSSTSGNQGNAMW